MNVLLSVCLAALVLVGLPARADAKWTRIATEHFVFVGDAPERQIRDIAQRLELFRDVLSRMFSSRATASPVPTVVVVFENDRSYNPFKPRFQGRMVEVGGYFTAMPDTNYITVNASAGAFAFETIFHEYTHFLLNNAVGHLPVWLNEGLAGFYETFEPRDGGKGAMIGIPSERQLRELQATLTFLPLSELLTVDHTSPLYNEGSRRGTFYAQSWALVHFLTLGSPQRAGLLQQYLTATSQGEPSLEAFHTVFGNDLAAIDEEVRLYVRKFRLNALRLQFTDQITAASIARGTTVSDADVAGYLGDLLVGTNRLDEARVFLTDAIAAAPHAAGAITSLGLLEFRESRPEEALALLERAVALAPDQPAASRVLGRLLLQRAARGGLDEDDLYLRARSHLAHARSLEPQHTTTMVMLAQAELAIDPDSDAGLQLLREVVAAVPGRDDYQRMLAEALARRTVQP